MNPITHSLVEYTLKALQTVESGSLPAELMLLQNLLSALDIQERCSTIWEKVRQIFTCDKEVCHSGVIALQHKGGCDFKAKFLGFIETDLSLSEDVLSVGIVTPKGAVSIATNAKNYFGTSASGFHLQEDGDIFLKSLGVNGVCTVKGEPKGSFRCEFKKTSTLFPIPFYFTQITVRGEITHNKTHFALEAQEERKIPLLPFWAFNLGITTVKDKLSLTGGLPQGDKPAYLAIEHEEKGIVRSTRCEGSIRGDKVVDRCISPDTQDVGEVVQDTFGYVTSFFHKKKHVVTYTNKELIEKEDTEL